MIDPPAPIITYDLRPDALPVDRPVTVWRNEVQAAVHPVVLDVPPVQAALILEVFVELVVDVLLTDPVTFFTVQRITETCGNASAHQRAIMSFPRILCVVRLTSIPCESHL